MRRPGLFAVRATAYRVRTAAAEAVAKLVEGRIVNGCSPVVPLARPRPREVVPQPARQPRAAEVFAQLSGGGRESNPPALQCSAHQF